MAKKVFDRIFKTIQIVINAIMGAFTILISFGSLFTDSWNYNIWTCVGICILAMTGFNVLNVYIRKLINNY